MDDVDLVIAAMSQQLSSNFTLLSQQQQQQQHESADLGVAAPVFVPSAPVAAALTPSAERAVREALRVNAQYRALLQAQVQRIDEQLRALNVRRRELQVAGSRQNRANQRRVAAVTDPRTPGAPYFTDPHGSEPAPNADAERKRRKAESGALLLESRYQTQPWRLRDRQLLASAVRQQTRERLTVALQTEFSARPASDLRLFAQKLRELAATTDAALELSVDSAAIDWAAIARSFVPERRAIDCQTQWENRQAPSINSAPFEEDERARLRELAARYNGANWPAIAAELGTSRRPWQCFQALQREEQTNFKGKVWTADEDARLRELVERFGTNWLRISSALATRTPGQCLHRWQKSQDPTIRRAKWQPDEDVQLRIATEMYGRGNWVLIARHVHGRTDVQCRERYVNVLDPHVNQEPFSPDEDARLLQLATAHAFSWTKVAQHMPGRTDGACWRRWQALVPPDVLEAHRAAARKRSEWSAVPSSRDEPTVRGVFHHAATKRRRRTSGAADAASSD
jgi:hypothetical protein